jgi:hypothetical protein
VWVHAKDIAGNWGPFQAGELVLDKTAPSLDALTRKGTGTVKVTAHDVYGSATHNVSSGIAGAEWFVGTDPGPGNGKKAVLSPTTALSPPAQNTPAVQTFDITGLPTGKVSVRVLDAAGNWSAPMTVQV